MKRLILIATLAAIAGLMTAGQALGSGEHHMGMSGSSDRSHGMMGEMHHGTTSTMLNQDQIREAQSLLNDRGYQVGTEDGMVGPRTKDAIRKFQEAQGLTATGNFDEPTLRALAPTTEKQEFFGLSPAYGGKESPGMEHGSMDQPGMKEKPMEQHEQTEGVKY